MKIYIRSAAAISAQDTFGNVTFPIMPISYPGNVLKTKEPDYKNYIDPKLARRMSRIIRMGVAAALQCLRDTHAENVDAIVTGTAYGCLEDTGVFLSRLIEQQEEMLSPTAFIQSTHNTVGAQIALTLQCTNYNNTFVHKAFSFESALLDSILLLKENEAKTVLVGGTDEITKYSFDILQRFNLYKQESADSLQLMLSATIGTIAGEGSNFFLLSSEPSATDYAVLDGVATLYKPEDVNAIEKGIRQFLAAHNVSMDDISCVVSGNDGDSRYAHVHQSLESGVFAGKEIVQYKQLTGEYPTSSSFALWLAANMIYREQPVFEGLLYAKSKKILVYNNYQNTHHSFMLLSAI